MRSRWNLASVRGRSPLQRLVYRSRLIGAEESLGLYGGGNTSIKCEKRNADGMPQDILWVKGSGSDLRTCEAKHFAPLPLAPLQQIIQRAQMSDEDMVAYLERHVLNPKSPRPSIETLLHAFIPEASIDHTHADAILSLTNTAHGARLVRRVLGPDALWIPYLQPGFALSRRVYEAYRQHPGAHGAVLEKHGLITWGPDGRTSYQRTIQLVSRAERFLARQRRRRHWSMPACRAMPRQTRMACLEQWLPAIRRTISASRKICLTYFDDAAVLEFVNAKRLSEVALVGPPTPDHMLRTRRLPLILSVGTRTRAALAPDAVRVQLDRYAQRHRQYVAAYRAKGQALQDPYPRVILMPGVGMLTTGKDLSETHMVARIYRHGMAIMRNAAAINHYTSVSARQAFGVEYWPLELYKLSLAPPEAELSGDIGLVTGAAGGIGRAIAERLIEQGACVALTDLDGRVVRQLADACNRRVGRHRALGVAMDVTDERSIQRALQHVVATFGGLDFLVSNAGVAGIAAIDRLARADWEHSLRVNATGHFLVAKAVVRWLRAQGLGGSLVFVASKNVLAPGKDFGAYSAAKAAETQLARVLAIENGEFRIRVNVVNPDGVFDGSGLWRTIKRDRAKTYGLAPSRLERYYQQRNLLKARVLPQDVAEAVGFFVSKRSAKTTGCILTVDGGLREAFPR